MKSTTDVEVKQETPPADEAPSSFFYGSLWKESEDSPKEKHSKTPDDDSTTHGIPAMKSDGSPKEKHSKMSDDSPAYGTRSKKSEDPPKEKHSKMPDDSPAYGTRSKRRANLSNEDHPAKQSKSRERDSPSSSREPTVELEDSRSDEESPVKQRRRRAKIPTKVQPKKKTTQSKPGKRSLQRENDHLKEELKKVTRETIQNARKGAPDSWDDATIEKSLKHLSNKLLEWTGTYALDGVFPNLKASEQAKFDTIFKKPSLYEGVCQQEDMPSISELSKGSRLVVEGLLWRFGCSQFLEMPFAFLNNAVGDNWLQRRGTQGFQTSMFRANYEEIFNAFSHDLGMLDSFQAQKWVPAVLGALKPLISPEEDPVKTEKMDDRMYAKYHRATKDLANTFLKGPASVLLKVVLGGDITVRRNGLAELLRNFREVAFHMHYQGVFVKYEYPGLLSGCTPKYKPKSDMKLHRMILRPDDDAETDEWIAGNKIILITNPAIGGNIRDEADPEKIHAISWIKSTVWPEGCRVRGRNKKKGTPVSTQARDAPLPESRQISRDYSEATEPNPDTVMQSVEDPRDYLVNPSNEYRDDFSHRPPSLGKVSPSISKSTYVCERAFSDGTVRSAVTNVEGNYPNDHFTK